MLAAAASGRALASGTPVPCATPGPAAPHRQPWRPGTGRTQRRQARHWQQQQQQRQERWHSGGGGGSAGGPAAARRCLTVCAAMKKGGSREKLPIFPLGMVALPAADVPLQVRGRTGGRLLTSYRQVECHPLERNYDFLPNLVCRFSRRGTGCCSPHSWPAPRGEPAGPCSFEQLGKHMRRGPCALGRTLQLCTAA